MIKTSNCSLGLILAAYFTTYFLFEKAAIWRRFFTSSYVQKWRDL